MLKTMLERALSYLPSAAKEVTDKIKKALMTWRITRNYLWRVKAEVDTFRSALELARNPLRYDRRQLYAVYREVELDDQVIAQGRVACTAVQRAPFDVMLNGKPNEKLADIFRRPWFFDLLEVAVKTEFWGHSLIEFSPQMTPEGEFATFEVVPRDFVRPEYGDVLTSISDTNGIPFREGKFPYLFEIGRCDDLGLYHVVAVPVIRKRYADTDWSLFSERFGSPFLTVKTASRDPKELNAKEEMLANFGSNGYAILDDQDDIVPIVAQSNGQAHFTFRDRMTLANEQISKIMNGQTGTAEEKAHVGSAEVHERILDGFTFARLTWIQFMVNFRLIPFLVSHGYKLDGARFEFIELRKKEKEAGGQEPEGKPNPQKKSPRMNTFSLHYDPYFHPAGCDCPNCREA